MFRVLSTPLVCVAPLALAACEHVAPEPIVRTITKTSVKTVVVEKSVPACPSDAEIADTIYLASRRIYQQKAEIDGRTGDCACDGETFGLTKIVCGSPSAGAIKTATWGFCRNGKPVPKDLLDAARAQFAACRKPQ